MQNFVAFLWCVKVYSTAGIPASPVATVADKVELFMPTTLTFNGLTNVNICSIVEDYKLTYFKPPTGSITFVQTGDRKVAAEVEGKLTKL